MGEASRKQTATQKFIEQFPKCCFCGGQRSATTREHMPPKSLFDGSHRPDRLVMPACGDCNKGTSAADLIVSMISRWSHDSGSPQEQLDHRRLAARAKKQVPDLVKEWTELSDPVEEAKARHHLIASGVPVPQYAEIATIGPLTVPQLNLFAHKVVLALYFEHFRQPLSDAGCFFAIWKTKEDFARDGIPPDLLNLLPGYGTLVQGRWNEQETFEYRHAMNYTDGSFGCFARFRRGFFALGFALRDSNRVPPRDVDWVKPSSLLALLDSPRFQKKL
jgi:hypothetical protein